MELVELIKEIISSYGFPIVMCCALFWKMNDQDKQHKEEMKQMSSALENNTLVMQQLVDALGYKMN